MRRYTIAIDPGAAGGIAWHDKDGMAQALPMPGGMAAQVEALRSLWFELSGNGAIAVAVVEKTGTYMPGNSGPSAATFARHCGHLEAALYTLGIPTEQVAPGVWQRALGSLPKDKGERKRAIKEHMARRYPHLKVTLATADALAILTWTTQKESNR